MNDTVNRPSDTSSSRASPLGTAARAGLASARENAIPGLVLWAVAVAIVAGYYLWQPVTTALGALGALKASGGYLYSAVSTAVFGGLIPFAWRFASHRRAVARGAAGRSPWKVPAWQACLFLTLFWCWKGIEIDFLYRMQAVVFGADARASTVIPKVLVDQFVYNPLWAGWTQVLAYWWLERSFKAAALVDRELWSTMGSRVVTVLISTWGVWIPIVSVIYAMPSNLQVPLFNIALCFWGLMLASLTKEAE